jgi:cytochrome c
MVSASFDYSAVIWSLPELEEKITLIEHNAAVNVAEFSPDGHWLATGGDDHQVLVWRVADLQSQGDAAVPYQLNAHRGKVVGLSFSRDGRNLVSSSWDGTARVWNLDLIADGDPLAMTLDGHEGPVNASQFSEDGKFLYTAGYDGFIRYWRIADATPLRALIKNGWGINVMYVDENAGMLAYGSTDGSIVIHDVNNDRELLRTGDEQVPVLSISAHPEVGQIAFGNADGMVNIIDSENMIQLRNFKALNGPVWSLLLLNQHGDMVVSGLEDHITKWQIFDFPPQILESSESGHRFHPDDDISNGEKQFARKCSVCHTLTADDKRRAGPSLQNLFGRRAGTLPGYKYSDALIRSDIIWTAKTVSQLFADGPDVVVPGTKMPIQRMKNEKDRDDLITYLEEMTKK